MGWAMNPVMELEALRLTVTEFVRAHQAWAPVIVGLLAFGESLAVISLFIPATVLLVGIGALIGASEIAFIPVVIGATVGASLGDWVSYEVGRYYEHGVKSVWPLSRYPALMAHGETFFHRYGVWAVVIGRFFGPARAVVPLVAGVFQLDRLPFQLANVGSAIVWAFVMLAPGAGLAELLRS
jgi:membrane protein DedA with SNARE-associated domain